ALQNHLLREEIIEEVVAQDWEGEDADLIALVISDVPSVHGANFLLEHLNERMPAPERQIGFVESIARSLPVSDMEKLVEIIRTQTQNDLDRQYKLAIATYQGMEQRGARPNSLLQNWYVELATDFLNNIPDNESEWTDKVKAQQTYAA